MRLLFPILVCLSSAVSALAAFGTSVSGSLLSVDTGGGLVWKIHTGTGDIRSIVYSGKELQDQSKFSHIASGFGSATVTYKTVNTNYIVVTSQSTKIGGTITQTFVAKKGDPIIYMSTHATAIPNVGELRFIFRLNRANLNKGYAVSDVKGCDTKIEGSDVFKCSDGSIHSKFYSSKQFIDDKIHGVTGSGVGAWMVLPGTAYEHSSGGPFFRDIDNQGSDQQELYFYMFSNHMQTEANRIGLFGPYALVVNTGSTPSSTLDTSFFGDLGINGYYSESKRGYVSGTASGVDSEYASLMTIGWESSHQQYWVRTDSSGKFKSPAMIPGTYKQTLYKTELEVGTVSSVTVTAGSTVNQNVASSEGKPSLIWSFGKRDGTPRGFYFADKIETTHPTVGSWGKTTLTVGSSSTSDVPMALFKDQNSPLTIKFTLSSSQVKASTLEIAITSSFAGGRPQVSVNGVAGTVPSAPTKIDSRGVSRGTWRGFNTLYSFPVAASTLKSGENSLTISVASGSSADDWWLSPNFVFDTIRFY